MLALVGPSGAGKTTLLRTIAGELPPRGGRVLLDGCAPAALGRSARSRIGMVSQSHDLVEALRADRNVMAGALGRWSNWRALRYLIWSTAEEAAEAEVALTAVGLAGMGKRRTASLSGGERQRLAIARTLIQAPALLLADEPVASLDPDNARRVLELLVSLAQDRGMALICSLHQPELAQRYFPRIAELRGGQLIMRG